MAETEKTESYSWWTSKMSAWNWRRTSAYVLSSIESKILSCMSVKPEGRFVPISDGSKRVWTLTMNSKDNTSSTTPLVLIHGMGAGVALWVLNLESLSQNRQVYAIDVLGFGRSSRVQFASDAEQVEAEFVQSIEDWRQSVGLERMILLGHSMGGYLAASYALKHADRVSHLIFADPWGFQERPPDLDQRPLPLWVKVARKVMTPLNPFSALRAAGPWGPSLITRFKSDLIEKYSDLFCDNRIADYLFHCNAQMPSGEIAFKNLTQPFGWARRPMLPRICDIPKSLSMTFIHGSRSWVDNGIGREVKYRRSESLVNFRIVEGAGHHVYADAPEEFNRYVLEACSIVDDRRESTFVSSVSHVCSAEGSVQSHGDGRVDTESNDNTSMEYTAQTASV